MVKQGVFRDFGEFWHYAKSLSEQQIKTIFDTLPATEQKNLKKSYKIFGWGDLFQKNQVDKVIDAIKKETGIDVIGVRCKVYSGKSHYMKKVDWEYIVNALKDYSSEHAYFAIGGIMAEQVDEKTVLIIKI
jgi:ribosomal protein S24E